MSEMIFVLDCDGVLSDGRFFYNKDGKFIKCYGSDDWDLIKDIKEFIPVVFITADKKGFSITEKRIVSEMGWELHMVSHYPKERWEWMKNKFPDKKIIYMGDGCYDFFALENCFFGITTKDALEHVKDVSDFITKRSGGDRAVAEACIHLMARFNLDWKVKYV